MILRKPPASLILDGFLIKTPYAAIWMDSVEMKVPMSCIRLKVFWKQGFSVATDLGVDLEHSLLQAMCVGGGEGIPNTPPGSLPRKQCQYVCLYRTLLLRIGPTFLKKIGNCILLDCTFLRKSSLGEN